MKLWIVSDLHVDHFPWMPLRAPEHNVMVIAGDVGAGREDTLRHLRRIARHPSAAMIFTPGNHDVFGGALDAFDDDTGLAGGGIHVLSSGQSVIIGDVRFVGATLWTDFALAGDVYGAEAWAAQHMPEYAEVYRSDRDLLWPADTSKAHALHRARIEAVLATPFDGPTVVVTHHAPSRRSISGALEAASAAFASDLEETIRRYHPELWIHGHIHSHNDYPIGITRIISNPRGYEGQDWYEDSGFIEDFVVEI